VKRGVHRCGEGVVGLGPVERDRQDGAVTTGLDLGHRRSLSPGCYHWPMGALRLISLDERARDESPLDAYSRVVTEVAQRLAPSVANLRVSRGGRFFLVVMNVPVRRPEHLELEALVRDLVAPEVLRMARGGCDHRQCEEECLEERPWLTQRSADLRSHVGSPSERDTGARFDPPCGAESSNLGVECM